MKIVKGTKAIVAVLFVAFISLSIFWIMQSVMVLSNRKHQIFTDRYKELVATHFFEGIDTLDTSPIKVTECKISKSTDYLSHRDVIVKVNDTGVETMSQMRKALDRCKPEQKVTVAAMRKGAEGYVEIVFDVTVGAL